MRNAGRKAPFLDFPMGPDRLALTHGIGDERGDVVARLGLGLAADDLAYALDQDDTLQALEVVARGEPAADINGRKSARLGRDASMALLDRLVPANDAVGEAALGLLDEEPHDIVAQRTLVALQRQYAVRAFVDDLRHDLRLGSPS